MCVTVDLIDSSLKSTALSSLFHETNVRELSICSSLKSLSSCERLSKLNRFVYGGVRNSHNLIDLCIEVWETHSSLTSSSLTSLWRCERLSHNSIDIIIVPSLLRGQTLRGLTPQKNPALNPATLEEARKDGQRSTLLSQEIWAQGCGRPHGSRSARLRRDIWHLTCAICYQTSAICYQTSDIRHLLSDIRH